MSMSDDWCRLRDLDQARGGLQYGQYLDVLPAPGNRDTVLVSKDLIRMEGEKTDINAWRVYLGPWQPRSGIPVVLTANYANPSPWAPPEPRSFDSFITTMPTYARVLWGSGGFQHAAYVDWPRRGLLFQVSGSYLQVNAFIDQQVSPGTNDPKKLPILHATIAPEPGGGDSLAPATYTYYAQAAQAGPAPNTGYRVQNFQVPPFARTFTPIIPDFVTALDTLGATLQIATQLAPNPIALGANEQVWQTPLSGGAIDDTYIRQPLLIAGQQVGTVRIEVQAAPGTLPPTFLIGCQFQLDM